MKSKLDLDKLKKLWKDLSNENEGDFSFKDLIQANVNTWIYVLKLNLKYKGYSINIEQPLFILSKKEYSVKHLVFKIEKESKNKFYLSIWKKDFFDRIFSINKVRTRDNEFDKKFGIKSNNTRFAIPFFNDKEIREIFLKDENLFFRVFTENQMLTVLMKHTLFIDSKDKFNKLYSTFKTLVDKLIETQIL